jgi:hypothetical protein
MQRTQEINKGINLPLFQNLMFVLYMKLIHLQYSLLNLKSDFSIVGAEYLT